MTTVFVGNLPPEITDSEIRALFETYGKVSSVRLVSRRGTAYVTVDPETAGAAVDALRGTQLKGRSLDVVLEDASSSRGRPGRRRARGRR